MEKRVSRMKKPSVVEALGEMHKRLGAMLTGADAAALRWALGGAGLLPAAPDLRRRFLATEDAIDELGRRDAAGEWLEARAIARAVEAHEAVWREIVERYRRHVAAGDRGARGAA